MTFPTKIWVYIIRSAKKIVSAISVHNIGFLYESLTVIPPVPRKSVRSIVCPLLTGLTVLEIKSCFTCSESNLY